MRAKLLALDKKYVATPKVSPCFTAAHDPRRAIGCIACPVVHAIRPSHSQPESAVMDKVGRKPTFSAKGVKPRCSWRVHHEHTSYVARRAYFCTSLILCSVRCGCRMRTSVAGGRCTTMAWMSSRPGPGTTCTPTQVRRKEMHSPAVTACAGWQPLRWHQVMTAISSLLMIMFKDAPEHCIIP